MVVGRPKLEEQLCCEKLHLDYPILFEGTFYVAKQLKKKKRITGGSSSNSLLTSSGHNYYSECGLFLWLRLQ